MKNLALLILRVTVGALMAGHGAQKLFGWLDGPGLAGTGGWLGSMGLHPRKPYAIAAGASEFGGGVLTALGFLNPLGPLRAIGAMSMAIATVHWNKPIWSSSGGAELPVINAAAFLAIGIAGSGAYSLDNLFGIKLPRFLLIPGLLAVAGTVAYSVNAIAQQPKAAPEEAAGGESQAGEEAHPA